MKNKHSMGGWVEGRGRGKSKYSLRGCREGGGEAWHGKEYLVLKMVAAWECGGGEEMPMPPPPPSPARLAA